MTITQLRYFAAVAQLENVSKAAEMLHLSQSSLSKNIAKLEAELGTLLFHRSGKKLVLNAPGARFLECSNLILRELEFAMDDMNQLATGADSKIRIGSAGASRRLMACIAAYSREHPGTEFHLRSNIEALEHLDINDFDALIYPAGIKYEKFTGYPLYEERYCLAAAAGHPLAEIPCVLPRKLDGQDFVFLRAGRAYIEYPFRACAALAVRFGSQCYVDNRELHRQMIASGLAVGFVPLEETDFYQDGAIRLIPIADRRFSRDMMICFRREKHLSPMAKGFRDFAISYFGLRLAQRG